jgi:pyruvate dehydrogenase E1 component alpha subunit
MRLPEGKKMELNREEAAGILYKLYLARLFEERLHEMVKEKKIHGTAHLSVGQEAVAVGAAYAARTDDRIMSNHRGHSHCIAKGADVEQMMCEIMGREAGLCRGLGGSMHIMDTHTYNMGANGIVGQTIPMATGVALALKKDGGKNIIMDFFGDGASNAGVFHESLNIAALWKLPIVYICENNGYGFSTSAERTVSVPNVADRAPAYGIPGVIVDGNDIFAVMEAVGAAAKRARNGDGPTLIEAKTYRWMGHSKSDKRLYRTREEEAFWREKCPIKRFECALLQRGFSVKDFEKIRKSAEREMEEAVASAIASLPLSMDEAKTLVYA